MFPAYYFFNALLIGLLFLHLYWTYLISKIVLKTLAHGKVSFLRQYFVRKPLIPGSINRHYNEDFVFSNIRQILWVDVCVLRKNLWNVWKTKKWVRLLLSFWVLVPKFESSYLFSNVSFLFIFFIFWVCKIFVGFGFVLASDVFTKYCNEFYIRM